MATITSPFPGTFYCRPTPESDPYVAVGDDITAGDVIGLVEIMKNFHEITSEEARSCRARARRERSADRGWPEPDRARVTMPAR